MNFEDTIRALVEEAMYAAVDDCHDDDSPYWGKSRDRITKEIMLAVDDEIALTL